MNNCIGQRVKTHKGHSHATGGVHRKQCRDGELAAARVLGLNPNLPCYCVIVCDWEETMKNRTNSVKQFINQMCASTPYQCSQRPPGWFKASKIKTLNQVYSWSSYIFERIILFSVEITASKQLCAVCRDRIWESGFFLWEIWCWCFSSLKTGFIHFFNLMYICTCVRIVFSFPQFTFVCYSSFLWS